LGIAVGVISFVVLIGFLVTDAVVDLLSSTQLRKYIVIADVCFSCAWGLMWLVSFSFLTDNWRRGGYVERGGLSRLALAFSFFNMTIFVVLSVLAILKLRKEITKDVFAPNSGKPSTGPASVDYPPPYASKAYSADDVGFSPHPFSPLSASKPASGIGDPPAY
jgi:hypothetical protein